MNEKDRLEVMALIERRSIPEPNTGCWLWDAATDHDGYGKTKWRGISQRAHRLSFEAFYNLDPGKLFVMHSCDIACCVNPDHLAVGSPGDNAREAAGRGRIGRGHRSWRMLRGASTTHTYVRVTGQEVTAENLQRVVGYNPDTGEFRWLDRSEDHGWSRKNGGKIAGATSQHGKPGALVFYRRVRVFGRDHYAHRLAWLYMTGEFPGKNEIDHINGDTLDNRFVNLRKATHAQNGHNTGLRRNNRSGVKGVSFDAKRGKWVAMITENGKQRSLGRYETMEEAVSVRRAAEEAYHGAFAHQGTELNGNQHH